MNKSAFVVACVAVLWIAPAFCQENAAPPVVISFYSQPTLVATYPSSGTPYYVYSWPTFAPPAVPLTNHSLVDMVGPTALFLPDSGRFVWSVDAAPRFGPPRLAIPDSATAARDTLRRY